MSVMIANGRVFAVNVPVLFPAISRYVRLFLLFLFHLLMLMNSFFVLCDLTVVTHTIERQNQTK